MTWRRIVRSLLLLGLVGALCLEGIVWLRVPLTDLVHRAYPRTAISRDGDVVYYDHEPVRDNGQTADTFHIFHFLDERRGLLETRREPVLDNVALTGHVWWSRAARKRFDFDQPRFFIDAWLRRDFPRMSVGTGPLESLASAFNQQERTRRKLGPEPGNEVIVFDSVSGPGWGVELPRRPPIVWEVEAGRLVCREISSGRVLAGVGPDGFVAGESGGAARFGELLGYRSGDILLPATTSPLAVAPRSRSTWSMIDMDSRRLVVLMAATDTNVAADSPEPLKIDVEMHSLHPWAGGDDKARKVTASLARIDGEHVLLFDDGAVFARFSLEPDERVVGMTGARPLVEVSGSTYWQPDCPLERLQVGVETKLGLAAPGTERRRFRLFRPGQAPVERDVTLTPSRASEILPATLAASLALLRPFGLNAASAASALPERWDDWWWRDPWLADGRQAGWLSLSLALAAFCAWRARRAARERCATVREVQFWTTAVLLLGPVGLLWMRFVLPRVPVEAVGGARRAVNLDASPSTAAPWPEPKPLGIEVLS
jgi:hypothetical protein